MELDVGIFSRSKSPKESAQISSAKPHETSLEYKAQIISEFVQRYKDDFEYQDFFDVNDLGVPLAIAITNDMADLTVSGVERLEETWKALCELFEANPGAEYEQLEDIINHDLILIDLNESQRQTLTDLLWSSPSYASHVSAILGGDPRIEDDILAVLVQIYAEVTGSTIDTSDFDKRFTEDLGIDSLALVEGMMACEDMFEIEISNQEAFELDSISKVAAFISRKRDNA